MCFIIYIIQHRFTYLVDAFIQRNVLLRKQSQPVLGALFKGPDIEDNQISQK